MAPSSCCRRHGVVTPPAAAPRACAQIKSHKLSELAASGVPAKYVSELARMRIKSAK
jgi:hypothetical protein